MRRPDDLKGQVAPESEKPEKLEEQKPAARRLYAAALARPTAYGGAEVGVITYKSTEAWIRANCHVPSWLKLAHWGDITGPTSYSTFARCSHSAAIWFRPRQ